MYRQYEDPHYLEDRLASAKSSLARATGEDEKLWWHEEIEDLEERINFAWQDIEYDEMY